MLERHKLWYQPLTNLENTPFCRIGEELKPSTSDTHVEIQLNMDLTNYALPKALTARNTEAAREWSENTRKEFQNADTMQTIDELCTKAS